MQFNCNQSNDFNMQKEIEYKKMKFELNELKNNNKITNKLQINELLKMKTTMNKNYCY